MTTDNTSRPTLVRTAELRSIPSAPGLVDAYLYRRHPRHPHTIQVTTVSGIILEVRVTGLKEGDGDKSGNAHVVLGELISSIVDGVYRQPQQATYIKIQCNTASRTGVVKMGTQEFTFDR